MQESNQQMAQFAKMQPNDARAKAFTNNPNVLTQLKQQSKLYNIKKSDVSSDKADFVFELSNNNKSRSIFEKEGISKDDLEKDIRNFVKRLLGRLVFLYFLQKKHWLGATNKNYDDGDTNFLFNLFNYNQDSKDNFYQKWLSKLFFNALNTPNRPNDSFELPNGNNVWIPFLNGGLFEEHQEPERHREIQFPPALFDLLFKNMP
jgi:hypothetical protein